jgi:hypothetical protein
MSYNEFLDWIAFFNVQPLAGDRADLHAAQVCAVLAEVNRNRKKRRKPFRPADFLPDWWGDRKRSTRDAADPQTLMAKMQALTEGWGRATEAPEAAASAETETDADTETYGERTRDAFRQA